MSALAADVYAWAKKATPDWTDFPALPIEVIDNETDKFVTDVEYSANKITIHRGDVALADISDKEKIALSADLGDVSTLTTTAKTAVGAINEHDTEIGNLSQLNTENKGNLVAAINEALQAVEVGGTGSVVTVADQSGADSIKFVVKQGGNAVSVPVEIGVGSGFEIGTGSAAAGEGTIPTIILSDETKASLAKADTALQEHQSLDHKADKVTGATAGNFAGLDANGNLTDSGKKAADFAPADIDTGVHSVALASGSENGTLKLTVDGVEADKIAVTGLQSAAYVTVDSLNVTAKGYADDVEAKLPTSADYGVLSVAKGDNTITIGGDDQHPTIKVTENTFDAYGAASEAEGRINTTLTNYYTKTEADAEFATPEEVIEEVNKALAAVSSEDAITNITTLVEYVNENASDLTALITEVYGSAEMTDTSRVDTAIADSSEAKRIADSASQTAGNALAAAGRAEGTANEAKTAATEAQNSASASAAAASASASTAAGSASAAAAAQAGAEGHASTASTKANEAAASAGAAAGSASEAAAAKQAAETAQGKAEGAQSAAEVAQSKAEAAQTAAERAQAAAEDAKLTAQENASAASSASGAAADHSAAAVAARQGAEVAQGKAEAAQAAAEAAQAAAENSNTSATAIANNAKAEAEAATAASNAATQAVAGLHAIATSGSTDDLVAGTEVWIFNCGGAE